MQETQVWSLGWEEPLKKEMATHSSILAWKIPWTEEPGKLRSMGLHGPPWDTTESDTTERLQFLSFHICIFFYTSCPLLSWLIASVFFFLWAIWMYSRTSGKWRLPREAWQRRFQTLLSWKSVFFGRKSVCANTTWKKNASHTIFGA